MIQMTVIMKGDGAWPELALGTCRPRGDGRLSHDCSAEHQERPGVCEDWTPRKPVIHLGNGAPPIQIAVLERGMTSGAPSLAIRLDLPDGRCVIAETSVALFCAVASAIAGRGRGLS